MSKVNGKRDVAAQETDNPCPIFFRSCVFTKAERDAEDSSEGHLGMLLDDITLTAQDAAMSQKHLITACTVWYVVTRGRHGQEANA